MEEEAINDECGHHGCKCDDSAGGGGYCSDHCRMVGLEGSGGECMCGHPNCGSGGG